MNELISWKSCLIEYVKKVEVDTEKIISLLKMCEVKERIISMILRDNETVSVVAEDYYEIIKELLVGLMLLHGMKSDNHECLIAFFKENYKQYESEANTIYELKVVRNRIVYNGFFIPERYLDFNESEFKHIIKILRELINNKLEKKIIKK